MIEQNQFLEILGEIKDIAILQNNQLTRDEIKKYLSDMKLDDNQIDEVCRYLTSTGIKILHRQQETVKISMSENSDVNSIIKEFLLGDESARNRLAECKVNHVEKLASSYKKRRVMADQMVAMDELIAEGNLGILIGISVIEKNKAQYFKNNGEPDYEAVNGIINMEIVAAMENFIDMVSEDKDWENAVLAKINLLNEAAKYLAEEYGKMPSIEELSEYTKVSAREISDIMNISNDTKKVTSAKS